MLVWLGGAGCRGCGSTGPEDVLALATADSIAALWVPHLDAGLAGAAAFATRATHRAGGVAVQRLRDGIATQLGFDCFDAAQFARAGIDPRAAALIFVEAEDAEPLGAVGIADRPTFDRYVLALLARTAGADRHDSHDVHGVTVHQVGRPFGREVIATLHWAHIGRFALVARGEGLSRLEGAIGRLAKGPDRSPNLAQSPRFAAARAGVPAGLVTAYAVSGADTLSASLTFGAAGVTGEALWAPAQPDLALALGGPPALPLAAALAPDAVAAALSRGARPASLTALRRLPAATALMERVLRPLQEVTGLDVEREVLPLWSGAVALGVRAADGPGLPQVLSRGRAPQALLDAVGVTVVAELRDAAAMLTLLRRARATLGKRGVSVQESQTQIGGQTAWLFGPGDPAGAGPRLGWGIIANHYVYAAGIGELGAAMQRLAAGPSALPATLSAGAASDLLAAPGSVLVLRGEALGAVASRLGDGGGAALRLGVGGLLESAALVLRTLGDVGIAVGAEAAGVRLRLREQLR